MFYCLQHLPFKGAIIFNLWETQRHPHFTELKAKVHIHKVASVVSKQVKGRPSSPGWASRLGGLLCFHFRAVSRACVVKRLWGWCTLLSLSPSAMWSCCLYLARSQHAEITLRSSTALPRLGGIGTWNCFLTLPKHL